MGYHDEVLFLVPKENLTEGRFAEAMVTLKDLHDDDDEIGFEPEDPSAPLFSRTPAPDILLDGWEYWMIASTMSDEVMDDPEDFDDLPDSPEFMGLFRIWVDGDALYEDEDAWQTFSEALVAIFDALGAVAAYHGTDNDYSAIGDAAKIFTMPVADFVMFAKDNMTPEEQDNLARLFNHSGESATGFWYRQGTQYDDALSKEQMVLFKRIHMDIWRRDPRLHGAMEVPEVELGDLEEPEDQEVAKTVPSTPHTPTQEEEREARESFEDLEKMYEQPSSHMGTPSGPGAVSLDLFDLDPSTGFTRFNSQGDYPGGAFFWVYFPKELLNASTCRDFVAEIFLYDGTLIETEPQDSVDLIEGFADFMARGHIALTGIDLPITPNRNIVTMDIHLVVTSGTDDIPSFGRPSICLPQGHGPSCPPLPPHVWLRFQGL
jgi:hypothetical protein